MRLAPLLAAWMPPPCVFCGATGRHDGVCAPCRADLPGWSAARCPICAIETANAHTCGRCLQTPPAFVRTVAAASYAFPLDAAIVRLKYGKTLTLVSALASLLQHAVGEEARPHAIVPMPLSAARLRERGFNQAAELAGVATVHLKIPVLLDAAMRTRDSVPQASLPLAERKSNVRGAFTCRADRVSGLHVAIVDDVMTTGASLEELASELRRAGAQSVTCWVVARTA
jgi:ComF family protein